MAQSWLLPVLSALLLWLLHCACAEDQLPEGIELTEALKRVEELHKTRQGLTSLKSIIQEIDNELKQNIVNGCILQGVHSLDCSFLLQDDDTLMNNWLHELSSRTQFSAEDKRGGSSRPFPYSRPLRYNQNARDEWPFDYKDVDTMGGGSLLQAKRKRTDSSDSLDTDMNDVLRKRRGLLILKRLLEDMDSDIVVEQKRMCRFNLGGHCATESAAAVANQFHYLSSPLSPGRKRRDTRIYSTLKRAQHINAKNQEK